jgi:hypothetical protein
MSSHNKIVKLFESIRIDGKADKAPEEVAVKPKKKVYLKPPANWSAWKLVDFIKENPEYAGNEAFEAPILADGLYMAGGYASEVRTSRWPKFEQLYLLGPNVERRNIFTYNHLEKYIQKFFSPTERSDELESSVTKALNKFKRRLNLAKTSDQYLFKLVSQDIQQITFTEIRKAVIYGQACGLEWMTNQAKELFFSFWELIVSRLAELPVTQEDVNAYCSYREGGLASEFSVVKLYQRLVSMNEGNMPDMLDKLVTEWTDRLTDLFINAIKVSARFDNETELKAHKSCYRIVREVGGVLKELKVFPEKLQKALEDQPHFWFNYVSMCAAQDKVIDEEMLTKLSIMYCEAIRQVVSGESGYASRSLQDCVTDFFQYLAKCKRRSERIEETLLSLDNLDLAKEYASAFK